MLAHGFENPLKHEASIYFVTSMRRVFKNDIQKFYARLGHSLQQGNNNGGLSKYSSDIATHSYSGCYVVNTKDIV
jgi:hypothetical protein